MIVSMLSDAQEVMLVKCLIADVDVLSSAAAKCGGTSM